MSTKPTTQARFKAITERQSFKLAAWECLAAAKAARSAGRADNADWFLSMAAVNRRHATA